MIHRRSHGLTLGLEAGCAAWAATQDREGAGPGQALLMCKLPDESIGSIQWARPARSVMWRSFIQQCAHPRHTNLGTCSSQPLEARAYCALRALASQNKRHLPQVTLGRAERQRLHLPRHINPACWREAGRRVRCYARSFAIAKHRIVFLGTPEVSVKPDLLPCRPAKSLKCGHTYA